jgi:hypothetical protein
MDDLRYPVGRFDPKIEVTPELRREWLDVLAELPALFREAVEDLSPEQLDTPYRPDGWTVRQLAHHVPDSHMNAYVRMKLALTEDSPAIKTYEEALWAELPDARVTPVEVSLTLLEALHQRWVLLLNALTDEQWARAFRHPEWGNVSVGLALGLYAWHSRHHLAHATRLRERMGWSVAAAV